jgi:2-polyprenyl-6-methoxyphenol hydroxylase-like FAD-dependent oxidoreductase
MTEVTIIGGGIAGLNLGIALQRRGIDFEIYERAKEYETLGAGIILRIPPMIVLDRLGLSDPIEKTGARHNVHVAFDSSGNELFHADLRSNLEPEFNQIGYGLRRNRLQEIQLDRLETDVHLGKRCVSVTQTDENATARFADGTKVTSDIVIGADGIFSQVRESLFPDISVEYTTSSFTEVSRAERPRSTRRVIGWCLETRGVSASSPCSSNRTTATGSTT